MSESKTAGVATPSVTEILGEFLEEQRERLSARTWARYRSVIELLQHSLNDYAPASLGDEDEQLLHRFYDAKGDEHREFCEVFGPEHIAPNLDEFLDYFMVRKVAAGQDLLRTSGTVAKKLAKWLHERGYVSAQEAQDAAAAGTGAARELPRAQALADALHAHVEDTDRDADEEFDGHFTVVSASEQHIELDSLIHGRRFGPVSLPSDLARRCTIGWTISGVVGRTGRTWRLIEVWNVYPR